jgi:pilus assembly protein CpaC
MKKMIPNNSFFQILVVSVLLILMSLSVMGQEKQTLKVSFGQDSNQPINIDLMQGQSRVIEFDQEYSDSQFSGKDIIDLATITRRILVVNANNVGQANLVVLKAQPTSTSANQMLIFNVTVVKNLSLVDAKIKLLYPKENIELSQVNDSVVISGSVTKPEIAADVMRIITASEKGNDKNVINLLKSPAAEAIQVRLEVRVAEVNRSILRELGAAYGIINSAIPAFISPAGPATLSSVSPGSRSGGGQTIGLSAVGSLVNIFLGKSDATSAFITALNTRGAIRTLAEPTLTTSNGTEGSFTAGGEVPIPIVNSVGNGQSGIQVTYKEYGVRLKFTPTVLDENHIKLVLSPEVSSIDYGSSVNLGSVNLPLFKVRKASTTIELRDGQSFAIAGLIDNSDSATISQIPGLGNIPIIGELFKSRSFRRNESELLFLCTVKIDNPLNPDQVPQMPGESQLKSRIKQSSSNADSFLPMTAPMQTPLVLPATGLLEGDSGHAVPRKAKKEN